MKRCVDQFDKAVKNLVLRPQDRYIPISNVEKLMKKAVVENSDAYIANSGKELMQKCVTEFIGFVTQEALERVESNKRKVLKGEDILWAMGNLGFENYSEHLRLLLQKHRVNQKTRSEDDKRKRMERKVNVGDNEESERETTD